MATEEELIADVLRKEPQEYKQWVCEQVGAVRETRKPSHKYPDGYIHEINTCIIAKQSHHVGKKDYEKASLLLSAEEKYKHIIIIAFAFDKNIIELADRDAQMRINLITVKELLKENYFSRLFKNINDIDNPTALRKVFKGMKI